MSLLQLRDKDETKQGRNKKKDVGKIGGKKALVPAFVADGLKAFLVQYYRHAGGKVS